MVGNPLVIPFQKDGKIYVLVFRDAIDGIEAFLEVWEFDSKEKVWKITDSANFKLDRLQLEEWMKKK